MGADPSSYCDDLPHSSLLSSATRSVCDGWRLGRIEAWLEIAAEEDYGLGGKCRRNREASGAGCMPQGAPTTPSLSHIYMRHFIVSWKTLGYAQCCGECHVRGRMVRDRALEEAVRATVERIMECLWLLAWPARFAAYGCRRNRSSSSGSARGAIVVESRAGSISARSRAPRASAARSAC